MQFKTTYQFKPEKPQMRTYKNKKQIINIERLNQLAMNNNSEQLMNLSNCNAKKVQQKEVNLRLRRLKSNNIKMTLR